MASDKTINLRIDVTKLKKEWFFKGQKGIYADLTLFYNKEQDAYGMNGMIVQQVPKEVYEKEKALPKDQQTRGPILGNCKDWATGGRDKETNPGEALPNAKAEDIAEDLPF